MSLSCERQKILSELKMPGGLCTQVVHWTQRTPLKPECENTPEFVSLPQVIPANFFWCNYSFSASLWWLISQTASGKLSFQIQTPKWDPITPYLWCLGRSLMTEVYFERWRGKLSTSWELILLQHHKFREKRTNAHPEQCCHPHQGG